MRQARFLAPGWEAGQRSGLYHCISRVVDRRFVLKRAERERFVQLMRLYEAFCGVRVLSYCVMSNHFHLLVEVPVRPTEGLGDEELLRRLALLYRSGEIEDVRRRLAECRAAGDEAGAAAVQEKYLYRMWDLSQFMKTLKQRFTQWFNKRHERRGTLWEDRFKSVIVEDGFAARVMAAYIDLNPVRAGMVKDPADYRWCGYGAAVGGRREARAGIARVMARLESEQAPTKVEGGVEHSAVRRSPPAEGRSWREVVGAYRPILLRAGEEKRRVDDRTGEETVVRRGLRPESGEKIGSGNRDGALDLAGLLRRRVRYFVDGGVIGSREFLEAVFQQSRERFGANRPNGARRLRGAAPELALFTLRDLRVGAIE